MINSIVIDLWFYGNFVKMNDISRECNLMADLLKFISDKKILSRVIVLGYNQIYCQTLSLDILKLIFESLLSFDE